MELDAQDDQIIEFWTLVEVDLSAYNIQQRNDKVRKVILHCIGQEVHI